MRLRNHDLLAASRCDKKISRRADVSKRGPWPDRDNEALIIPHVKQVVQMQYLLASAYRLAGGRSDA